MFSTHTGSFPCTELKNKKQIYKLRTLRKRSKTGLNKVFEESIEVVKEGSLTAFILRGNQNRDWGLFLRPTSPRDEKVDPILIEPVKNIHALSGNSLTRSTTFHKVLAAALSPPSFPTPNPSMKMEMQPWGTSFLGGGGKYLSLLTVPGRPYSPVTSTNPKLNLCEYLSHRFISRVVHGGCHDLINVLLSLISPCRCCN